MAMPRKWPGMTQPERDAARKRAYRLANVEAVRASKHRQYLAHREVALAGARQQTVRRRLERQGVPVDPVSIAMRAWK